MFNENQTRYIAKVIKNNSTKNTEGIPLPNGSVQIYIEPLMSNWEEDHYPWAFPYNDGNGGSSDFGTSCIPEEDSYVWVWHERKDFKNWFYGGSVNNPDINPHTLFITNIQAELLSQSVYPNAKYMYFKNGICVGVDSSETNPEFFILHPMGSQVFIDNLGDIFVKGTRIFLGVNKAESLALQSDPLSGVTTGASHNGVIDTISGAVCTQSTSVFCKL